MTFQAAWKKKTLICKRPLRTSFGCIQQKEAYFVFLWQLSEDENVGLGECSPLVGLSRDHTDKIEQQLDDVCCNIDDYLKDKETLLNDYPALCFALECAELNLSRQKPWLIFPSTFTQGESSIPINGLVWMERLSYMRRRVQTLMQAGFSCIKLKIGALKFSDELSLIREIRKQFSSDRLEIRLDANGAFGRKDVFSRLEELAKLGIHSIEQPIQPGQEGLMAEICRNSPVPVALDEELISWRTASEKAQLLGLIKPQFLVLKPTLLGGFSSAQEWINTAQQFGIDWWVTSALESNIGLNALAQWTASIQTKLSQGLGTGLLFKNNIPAPLSLQSNQLWFEPSDRFDDIHLG